MAVNVIANQVRSGDIEIGLAIGLESMSEKYVYSIPWIFSYPDPTQ